MSSQILVCIEPWNHHGMPVQHAFHSAIPELWAEAETPESALRLLADRLARSIEYATDEFHQEPIRRAIDDVSRVLSGSRDRTTPVLQPLETPAGTGSTTE